MSLLRRCGAALLAAALLSAPAVAADPLPQELRKVPRDAALFVHVDVAALWKSKLGDNLRGTKSESLQAALDEAKKVGFTPDMVKTVTVCIPQLKEPGDLRTAAFHVTFTKPYDKAKILDFMKAKKLVPVERPDGTVVVDAGLAPGADKNDDANKVLFVMSDPTRIEVFLGLDAKFRKDRPADETGPLDPALTAAAAGATVVLGLNFANLPDEIRGDEVPPEVRPFQPLFRSDVLVARAKLVNEELKVEARFRNKDRAKTMDAEKSLAAGVTLMQLALGAGIQELEKIKKQKPDNPEVGFLPLAAKVAEALKTARVAVEETDAVATATVPTDLPIAALLEQTLGSNNPRTAAARANVQNHLKQIGLAMHNYHDTYGSLPPSAVLGKKGKPLLSWRVMILPYIEQDALYRQFKLDEPWDSAHNKAVLEKHPMPPVYRIPGVTKDTDKATHMQVFTGNDAMFDLVLGHKLQQIADGTSNTLMAALAAKAVPWTAPDDVAFDPKADPTTLLLFPDMKTTSVLFGDGSVRQIQKAIKPDTLRALITKAGGEVVGDDF